MMQEVKRAIIDYIDHVQDNDYIHSTVHLVDAKTLFDALHMMLQSNEMAVIQAATLFIRDVALLASVGIREWFQPALHESEIIVAICQNLNAPNHFVRCDAVYTLGKVGARECLSNLKAAFAYYRERDPLLMPRLLDEMFWLGYRPRWRLIDQLIHSSSYPSRWAALAIMDNGLLRHTAKVARVKALARDRHSLIAREADHRLRCWQSQPENETSAAEHAGERKRQLRMLRKDEPKITFANMEVQFHNELWRAGNPDYQLWELEEFVEKLA